MEKGNGFRMFEGKRCYRSLLSVVVALVVAMATAFGLVSTSLAADSSKDPKDFLTEQKVTLTVRDVERGVTGTAYRYAYADWNTTYDTPSTSNYIFEEWVASWMKSKMRGGIRLLSVTSPRAQTTIRLQYLNS